MNKIPESQILIIFGASGALTHRKLIPSLFELFERKLLPDKFLIVGVSRTKQSTEEFRQSFHHYQKKRKWKFRRSTMRQESKDI